MKLIPLSQEKYAKVDDEDFSRVNQFKWCYTRSHGASYRRHGKGMMMHRFILDAPKYLEVDHINGDHTDNRRSNLRFCTHAENMRNSKMRRGNKTGYKGVYLNGRRWAARLQFNGKTIHFGQFNTKEEAAEAYNKGAKIYFGEFARLNEL